MHGAPPKPSDPTPASTAIADHLAKAQAALASINADQSELHKLAALGGTASILAHEVNNVLTPALSYLSCLRRDLSDEAFTRRSLERIEAALAQTVAITSTILRFAKPSASSISHDATCDCNAVVTEATQLFLEGEPKHPTRVATAAKPVLASIAAVELRQVLVNLLKNAAAASSPTSAPIEISTRPFCISNGAATQNGGTWHGPPSINSSTLPDGLYACITVRDHGCGMTSQQLEEYYRTLFAASASLLSGLGTAFVRQIIHSAHGHIFARSTPGEGTEITLIIPSPPTAPPTSDPPGSPPPTGPRP